MGVNHLYITDSHAHPQHHNKRAEWLGQLIADIKPDVVIHGGDSADMPSLSTYDKGKRSFAGRSYRADIDSHLDFQDRMWHKVKKQKKKLPRRIFLIGNHEHRISRALDLQPELDGTIGLEDLELDKYYDTVVPYEGQTPGVINVDGINYAHYFVSGVMGQPLSGLHPGASLLGKNFCSCSAGHSHLWDHCVRTDTNGRSINGLVAGCYMDYDADWAGSVNNLWWRGLAIKWGVDNGHYDLEQISMKRMEKVYGERS